MIIIINGSRPMPDVNIILNVDIIRVGYQPFAPQ